MAWLPELVIRGKLKRDVSDAFCLDDFNHPSGCVECSCFALLTDRPTITPNTTIRIRRNNTPPTTMYTIIPLLLTVTVGNKVVEAKGVIFVAIISESKDLPVTVMVLL